MGAQKGHGKPAAALVEVGESGTVDSARLDRVGNAEIDFPASAKKDA